MRLYYHIKEGKFIEEKRVNYKDIKKGVVIATNSEKEAVKLINDVINICKNNWESIIKILEEVLKWA